MAIYGEETVHVLTGLTMYVCVLCTITSGLDFNYSNFQCYVSLLLLVNHNITAVVTVNAKKKQHRNCGVLQVSKLTIINNAFICSVDFYTLRGK